MKHAYILVTLFAAFITITTEAQVADKKSVVIGTMENHPNALLILNPPLKDQGVLLPKLTTQQREENLKPVSPGDDGLIVFDSDVNIFYYWKSGQWHEGLGTHSENQKLTYDVATHKLKLNLSGGDVDLSSLKEIPAATGNAGKYISTNGTDLVWSAVPTNDNIKNIVTGQGLSGGGTTSTVNLAIRTDNLTVGVNGSDALEVKNAGITTMKIADQSVTPAKILPGINKQVLTTDATGKVTWSTPAPSTDNQSLSITGNSLSITNGNTISVTAAGQVAGPINNLSITDGTVTAADLATDAVTNLKLANNAVSPTKILSGGNDKVLTTNATGVVTWANRSAFPNDTQMLSLTGNSLSITNGNTISVTAAGQVAGPINNLSITDGTVTAADLATDAVTSLKIANNAVSTTKILSGGNDKVLTTNATGVVTWANRSTFIDDNQNLALVGNTLNIDNGTSVNLNALTVGGQLTGTINNLAIANNTISGNAIIDNSINTAELVNGAVTTVKIQPGANNQVLTTAGGVATWAALPAPTDASVTNETITGIGLATNTLSITEAASTFNQSLNGLTLGGDVIGNLNTNKVTKIQNNLIDPATLSAGDNGKILVWNGTQWSPTLVAGVTTADRYYSIDPSDFQSVRNGSIKDKDNIVIFEEDNEFVTIYKRGEARSIMAPLHLPDGVTMDRVTISYMDKSPAGNISVKIYRKQLAGGKTQVGSTWNSTGNSGTIRSQILTTTEMIANNLNTYRIEITLNPDSDTDDADDAELRIYGVSIRYK
jgi:hypothetical protein